MRARRTFAALFLIASLGIAGCGASDTSSGAGAADDKAQSDPKPAAEGAGGSAADAKAPAKDPVSVLPTHIIRTAELNVEVKDAPKALADARAAVQSAGGHVAGESTERIDDTHVTSRVVLRVPQEKYDSVLAELAGSGKLLSRKAEAEDVTGQVVDVESRIATQRASVARVRALMDRAAKLSDVVTLEGQLSSRQAQLESLLAQQAALKDRTTLATITLMLSERENKDPKKEDDDPGFLDALGGGWDALVATGRWIAVAVGAVAPFAAVFVLLYAVWRWVVRPRLAKHRVPGPAAATAPLTPYPAPGPDQD
ncbi:DUF4349 domain-containing protein [Streptomyces lunaelactis]|uniref:DUF4349 domain-containing protein n=1 Tax=Streptomyces lunaelactis TaxID=1535768 RepID=UPI00158535C4|nr:DUF4349 domain-containing protein [Streptomyces lunaelactis]NUL06730.1 DUF4349 domain-containing protein [Streptomyces lunaelactis]